MNQRLITIINKIRDNKGFYEEITISDGLKLREDLGFDSLDLAELTVRIENEFGVDIFQDGVISTVGEIITKLKLINE